MPFSISDEVMMQLDTKRHPEEENAALREEIARLRVLLYGKKSERVVAANLDLTLEEAPAKDEPNAPATDKPQQNKTDTAVQRTHRLRVHYTREIEETLIPDEVKAAPADYERLPESAERVSVRVESVPAHLALHIYRCHAFVRIGKRGRKKQQAPIRAAAPATILPGCRAAGIDCSTGNDLQKVFRIAYLSGNVREMLFMV